MPEYREIDQRIHLLCQIIAKANRTFVLKQADDSHTNLYFDEISNRIFGRWTNTKTGRKILALNLTDFCLEWFNDKRMVVQSCNVEGKNLMEIESEIELGLYQMGLEKNGFRDKLHFKIPKYEFTEIPFQKLAPMDIVKWSRNRGLANQSCNLLSGYLQIMSEVRIWPHHFDTGIYAELNSEIGIGFGLAMADSLVADPYFYISAYGLNGNEINYNNLCNLTYGYWEVGEYYKGAVLPLTETVNLSKIQPFFLEFSSWMINYK
jgi:hypothetical protein